MLLSEMSRDAQVVALGLFMTGYPQRLSFKRPEIITPRLLKALDELTKEGFIANDPEAQGKGWKWINRDARPIAVLHLKMTDADNWALTTE